MQQSEELYKKGFNNGYLLAKHEPGLINKIIKEDNASNDYFDGLRLGRKEYERERIKAQLEEQENTKSKDIEIDDVDVVYFDKVFV